MNKRKKGHNASHLSKIINEAKKEKRIKNDKELDQTLENTFPASDATAKYQ